MNTGDAIVFDVIPDSAADGILSVRGRGLMPEFSDALGAENPLSCLPRHFQIAPAYYILSQLPFDPEKPVEQMRYQKYSALWKQELDAIQTGMSSRKFERSTY